MQLTDFVLTGMDKRMDQKVLLKKMIRLDFKTSESYLSSRKLFVYVGNIFLETGILNCGVSQGDPVFDIH